MTKPKRKIPRAVIRAEQVPEVFSCQRIEDLLRDAKLPNSVDLAEFCRAVRIATTAYVHDARQATANEMAGEIEALRRLVSKRMVLAVEERRTYDLEEIKRLLASLSPNTRTFLNERAQDWARPRELPEPESLDNPNPEVGDRVCNSILDFIEMGAWLNPQGRKRAGGKHSKTLEHTLHAPERQMHPRRLAAEADFVWKLAFAWQELLGKPAPRVHAGQSGPFKRFVGECLRLVGAPHCDMAELINLTRGTTLGPRSTTGPVKPKT